MTIPITVIPTQSKEVYYSCARSSSVPLGAAGDTAERGKSAKTVVLR